MTSLIFKKIIILFFYLITSFAHGNDDKFNKIEVLVNENVITKYDIVQRLKINAILNRVEINDDNYSQLLETVIDDLIVEKLKIIKINEYNVDLDKDEFTQHQKRFFQKINYKKTDLEEIFKLNDVKFEYLTEYLEVDIKWQKLIYGLYLRVSSVTEQEVSDLINKNPDLDEEAAGDLILQKQLDLKSIKLIKDLRDEATIEYK